MEINANDQAEGINDWRREGYEVGGVYSRIIQDQ